ncbi:MAG: response regulator [Deltaproteobacteria bacterium]|nr:response regulator [Deltaproteobacteria bacterium]
MISKQSANILLASDDKHLATLSSDALTTAGHKVSAVYDTDSAIITLNAISHVVKAVILDLDMPGGYDVLEWLGTNNRDERLKTVCLAAKRTNAAISAVVSATGADNVLTKDMSSEKFVSEFNTAVFGNNTGLDRNRRMFGKLKTGFRVGQYFYDGMFLNISRKGAFLRSNIPLEPNAVLKLRFKLDAYESRSIEPVAVVRWTTPNQPEQRFKGRGGNLFAGAGIEFISLPPAEERNITEFVGVYAA